MDERREEGGRQSEWEMYIMCVFRWRIWRGDGIYRCHKKLLDAQECEQTGVGGRYVCV